MSFAPLFNEAQRRLVNQRREDRFRLANSGDWDEPVFNFGIRLDLAIRDQYRRAQPRWRLASQGHHQPFPIHRAGLATSNQQPPRNEAAARSPDFASIVPNCAETHRPLRSLPWRNVVFSEISSISHVPETLTNVRNDSANASLFNAR
jgi:hypothetical protein